jgi:hypothetical protein
VLRQRRSDPATDRIEASCLENVLPLVPFVLLKLEWFKLSESDRTFATETVRNGGKGQ